VISTKAARTPAVKWRAFNTHLEPAGWGVGGSGETVLFGGSFRHTLDTAGRFIMPKRFRSLLGEDFWITKGLGCLCVFTKEYVDKTLTAEIEGLGGALQSLLNPDILRLTRHYFSNMQPGKADTQSRVQLTPEHRKYAGIEEEVVIRGCGSYIELWSPAALEQYEAENDRVEDIFASAAALLPPAGAKAPGVSNAGVPSAGSA